MTIGPITDLGYFGVIGDAAIIVALVPKDDNFWDCNEEFLGRDGCTSAMKMVEYAVDIIQVFSDEMAHLIVCGDCLISTIVSFVVSCRPFYATIVHEGPGDVGDFRL